MFSLILDFHYCQSGEDYVMLICVISVELQIVYLCMQMDSLEVVIPTVVHYAWHRKHYRHHGSYDL